MFDEQNRVKDFRFETSREIQTGMIRNCVIEFLCFDGLRTLENMKNVPVMTSTERVQLANAIYDIVRIALRITEEHDEIDITNRDIQADHMHDINCLIGDIVKRKIVTTDTVIVKEHPEELELYIWVKE